MVDVVVTSEFVQWYDALDLDAVEDVNQYIDLLEDAGTRLGFPHSSAIKGASFPLRELRVQSRGRPLRVFYAFDPKRRAAVLLGGDKTGDDRFYETMIPPRRADLEKLPGGRLS